MIINIRDKEEFGIIKAYCKVTLKTVGLTSGTFDLFHDYHLRYLERCRRLCEVLIVGVDSDRHVKEVKGPSRPILSEFQRSMLINSNKCVSICYIQDTLYDFAKVAENLVPGGKIFRNQVFEGKENEVEKGKSNAEVIIVPDIEEATSTSFLVNKIKE
jgi:D-beta-D-heptose 7-phosphate kinase/D-beta-D-heptose 1-phosphate adenosyltransferase